jgi:hypothetical protein
LVTHDPELASVAHMSIALRDGRVVSRSHATGFDPAAADASPSGSRVPDPGSRVPDPGYSS